MNKIGRQIKDVRKGKGRRYLHLYINASDEKQFAPKSEKLLRKVHRRRPERSLQRVSPQQQRPLSTVVPSWQLYRRRLRRVGTGRQYSKPPLLTCHLNSSSLLGPIFFLLLPLLPGQKNSHCWQSNFHFHTGVPSLLLRSQLRAPEPTVCKLAPSNMILR